MQGASPLWVQLLIIFLGPPIMAVLVHFLSRGWAFTVQGGKISERTQKRQRWEFWFSLCLMYAICFGLFIYGHFIKH